MYRKDLFDEKGLKMPEQPTYDDIKKFADALTDKSKGIYGITLRGKPGWGENMAFRSDEKGLKMPEQPTYDDIKKFADALTDKSKGIYGITLRGKPGWGENMAFVDTLLNTFGATWFDMKWTPTIDTPEWKKAITFYVDLMKKDGPPGASSNGFNENLTLFASGKAAMWIDAPSGAGPLYDKPQSKVSR